MISVYRYTRGMSRDLMELTRSAVKQSGMSLFEIARRAGIAYSRIHDLMNGRTAAARAGTLDKIIAACGAELKLSWRKDQRERRQSKGR